MQSQLEFQERLERAVASVESLPAAAGGKRGEQLRRALVRDVKLACEGYRAACNSTSPDQFIERISAAAAKAKRTTSTLVLLVQLDYLHIDEARDVIIEARALERILTASRNTAKRRRTRRKTAARDLLSRARA